MLWFIGSQRVGHDCATELNISSFLHLWMMFSLSIFLPINMLHDLTFDKIKLILSSFFPFFLGTEDCFFYASSFKDLSIAFEKS